jgi:hypothetical protein
MERGQPSPPQANTLKVKVAAKAGRAPGCKYALRDYSR